MVVVQGTPLSDYVIEYPSEAQAIQIHQVQNPASTKLRLIAARKAFITSALTGQTAIVLPSATLAPIHTSPRASREQTRRTGPHVTIIVRRLSGKR